MSPLRSIYIFTHPAEHLSSSCSGNETESLREKNEPSNQRRRAEFSCHPRDVTAAESSGPFQPPYTRTVRSSFLSSYRLLAFVLYRITYGKCQMSLCTLPSMYQHSANFTSFARRITSRQQLLLSFIIIIIIANVVGKSKETGFFFCSSKFSLVRSWNERASSLSENRLFINRLHK